MMTVCTIVALPSMAAWQLAANAQEPGRIYRLICANYAAYAHSSYWHYPESLSRRIKSVRYLRDKRPIRSGPRAPIERPPLTQLRQ